MRHTDTLETAGDIYDDGHLRVEHDNYFVTCAGVRISLTRAEFLILSRLARSAGRVVPLADLWHHAWGKSKPLNAESLHVYTYRLRKKLQPFGVHIETMINVGYSLSAANPHTTRTTN
jgi:DNA-binding response OmpR family regulator